jgi:hypothetical protein
MQQRTCARNSRGHRQRCQRGQSSVYRNVREGRKRSQSCHDDVRFEPLRRRGEDISPLEAFAPPGLVLPRLDLVPSSYQLETGLQETAQLARALVHADVLPYHVYKDGQGVLEFLNRAFETRLTELGLDKSKVSVTLRLADEGNSDIEGVYFTVNLEPVYLDLGSLLKKLDAIDLSLAPALVEGIRLGCETLVPVYEGQCCCETVTWLIWGGDEEELLERVRDELASARRVLPAELSQAEVTEFAESHYLTSTHVNERLEPRFQQPTQIPLEDLQTTFAQQGCNKLVELCAVLKHLERLDLPVSEADIFIERGDYQPYGLVLGLPRAGANDFVGEMFGELEQYVWSGGEWAPSYVIAVNWHDDTSFENLATGVEVVLQGLACVAKLVTLLEEASQ